MITLPTDSEQLAGLQSACDNYNAVNGTALTLDEYASLLISAEAQSAKLRAIDAKGRALIEAAKSMPDGHRIAFTSVVESIAVKFSQTPADQIAALQSSIQSAIA